MDALSKAPVALFIHSRPRETKRVVGAIKAYVPQSLYVVADGPRLGVSGEAERCLEARAVVDSVDWECDVRWLRRDTNFGSGRSVKEGLDWVFSQEERAIILEDDTVPERSFFSYCEELLALYEDNPNVGMISGNNLIDFTPPGGTSYFFSQIPTTWGWATWRRSWNENDFKLSWLHKTPDSSLRQISLNRKHLYYWMWVVRSIEMRAVDAWDWQWFASLALGRRLTIIPRRNLVENIGFGPGATHTVRPPKGAKFGTEPLELPMSHPSEIKANSKYDRRMISRFLPERRPEVLAIKHLHNWLTRNILDSMYLWIRRKGGMFSS